MLKTDHPVVERLQRTGSPYIESGLCCALCHEPLEEWDDVDDWDGSVVHKRCCDEMDSDAMAIEYIMADTTAFESFLKEYVDKPYLQKLFKAYKSADRNNFEAWALG